MRTILFFSLFLLSCSSIQVPTPSLVEFKSQQKETLGTISIPVTINLNPIFKQVNQLVDYRFTGDQQVCEGVSFSYQFTRNPITFSGIKNTLITSVDGAYWLKANYCVRCTEIFNGSPFCVSPRLFVSCGIDEPLRQAELSFASELELNKNYTVKSRTKLESFKTSNACQFTFLKYDASKLLEKELQKPLDELAQFIDREVGKVNLKPYVDSVWKELQNPIAVQNYGFLQLQPKSLGVENIQFKGNLVSAMLNLSVSPQFVSTPDVVQKSVAPTLSTAKVPEGFSVPVGIYFNYDSLNQIIKHYFVPVSFREKRKQITLTALEIVGPVKEQLLLKINFIGKQKGSVYLLGTPTFDWKANTFQLSNISFEVESKNKLLQSAAWLLNQPVSKQIEKKLSFNIVNELNAMKKSLSGALNQRIILPNGQYLKTKGVLDQVSLSEIDYLSDALHVTVLLSGNCAVNIE